jgi:multiple sugar transport system substrate-binding protein
MSANVTRRDFMRYSALTAATLAVAGCAPKAQPTPAAPAAEKPAEQPADKPASKDKIELRYMERDGLLGDFMRHASRLYEEQNPHITVKNEPAGWGDLTTKVPTMVAAGTMTDLAFQHGAFMLPMLGKKGAWLDMTPAAERDNHDFDIYYHWALDTCRLGPKDELVAMPMGVHFGQNELHWNVELFEEMGIDQPHDQMTKDELVDMWLKVQAKMGDDGFATDLNAGSHFNTEHYSRSFGGYVVGPTRKECGFNLETTQDAFKWLYDVLNEYHVMPDRGEVEVGAKDMFYSGTMATWFNCSANVWVGFEQAVEDRFTLGHCVWPHGEGLDHWGTVPSCDATVIYGKTKYPDESWGLAKLLSSFEVSKWTAVSDAHMTPGAVIAAWNDPEVWEACPPYKNCAQAWDTLPESQWGNMGVPDNTRRKEFDDHHDTEWQKMLYRDVPFNKANVDKLHDELQEIMDKPVP